VCSSDLASYVESDPRDAIVEEICRTVELVARSPRTRSWMHRLGKDDPCPALPPTYRGHDQGDLWHRVPYRSPNTYSYQSVGLFRRAEFIFCSCSFSRRFFSASAC
jgi:hypothetical protein